MGHSKGTSGGIGFNIGVILLLASFEGTSREDDEFCKTALDDVRLQKIARAYT